MKRFAFVVNCGFTMQYAFDETEIGPDGEPTKDAVIALEKELTEYISQNYGIDFLEADVDTLLGISDESN